MLRLKDLLYSSLLSSLERDTLFSIAHYMSKTCISYFNDLSLAHLCIARTLVYSNATDKAHSVVWGIVSSIYGNGLTDHSENVNALEDYDHLVELIGLEAQPNDYSIENNKLEEQLNTVRNMYGKEISTETFREFLRNKLENGVAENKTN